MRRIHLTVIILPAAAFSRNKKGAKGTKKGVTGYFTPKTAIQAFISRNLTSIFQT